MIKRYTFLKHPFYLVLKNASEMVGGLEKCVAVFYDESVGSIEVLASEKEITPIGIKDVEFVKSLRKTKKQANWIKENQVAFEVGASKMEQLSFKDEAESSVLELRFLNLIDGNYDVLYFYFKNNIGNFKLSTVDEAMAITVKEVIQNLLYRQISLLLDTHSNNAQIHQKIKNTLTDNTLQERLTRLEIEHFEQAKSNYNYLLKRLTAQEEVEFVLSNQAIQKIKAYNLPLEDVEALLTDSLELILNKYNPQDFYELTSADILKSATVAKPSISVVQGSLNKTEQFLDRYESAAKVLRGKNQKITGLNIGESCYPRVSPAAISDVLKKHQKKIVTLFEQHPERWSLIRSHFKPVVNIVERFKATHQSQMGA